MSTSDNLLRHQPLSRGIRLNFRHSAKPRTAISSPHHRTRFRCHKKDILSNLIQVYPPTHDIRLLPYTFISPRTKSSPDKVVHRTRSSETHTNSISNANSPLAKPQTHLFYKLTIYSDASKERHTQFPPASNSDHTRSIC